MWGRNRQPAEDRTPLIQQDALPEGDASVQGRPTLPLSRLGRRLLSWMRDVIENGILPSSRHAGPPFHRMEHLSSPESRSKRSLNLYSKPEVSPKVEEQLQPIPRTPDPREPDLTVLDSEDRADDP
jgi:hypothetical protein